MKNAEYRADPIYYCKIALSIISLVTVCLSSYVIYKNFGTDNRLCDDSYVGCGNECTYIDYDCKLGKEAFYDGVGCGCKAVIPNPITPSNTNENYIRRDIAECMAIDYVCEPGTNHFNDDIGCGCK